MRLFTAEEDAAFAVRGHTMDLALVARGHEHFALAVEGQRPDIFGLGIVEDFGFSRRGHLVDFAIRAGGYEHLVLAIDYDRMHFESVEGSQSLLLAARRDPVQPGVRA